MEMWRWRGIRRTPCRKITSIYKGITGPISGKQSWRNKGRTFFEENFNMSNLLVFVGSPVKGPRVTMSEPLFDCGEIEIFEEIELFRLGRSAVERYVDIFF
ncbi:hypothetical protein GWI33_004780 [Rhynchophorus ferrugineus]|uniref:Uncharacterized protein n=1 Tax=Rhynchophorus ferrugineus TaxID=354439 RepID=A0A834MF82_RHYFE|nr:hypothetical protein GWI33_004780 [Rhynchophorus ferrugineus]